jgi:hypothetical protein
MRSDVWRWVAGRTFRVLAAAAAIALAGCGAFEESPAPPSPVPATSNLLLDPGFETTNPPAWLAVGSLTVEALIPTEERARGGTRSAVFRSDGLRGAVQAVATPEFPEFVSGYYRVDSWPDGGSAYLELSVRAPTGAFAPVPSVRFLLAGATADPEPSPDAPSVFLSRDAPAAGAWTYFAYPVRQAFIDKLAAVPPSWASIDVTVEVRSAAGAPLAVAYFDDLYLGSQAGNPNRPKETRQ